MIKTTRKSVIAYTIKTGLILLAVNFVTASSALAYIGPGAAGGAIIAAIGIVLAILVAILGMVILPIKRLIKNRKRNNKE